MWFRMERYNSTEKHTFILKAYYMLRDAFSVWCSEETVLFHIFGDHIFFHRWQGIEKVLGNKKHNQSHLIFLPEAYFTASHIRVRLNGIRQPEINTELKCAFSQCLSRCSKKLKKYRDSNMKCYFKTVLMESSDEKVIEWLPCPVSSLHLVCVCSMARSKYVKRNFESFLFHIYY